jgi:iron complex transport system substrate-binding protein
MRIIGLLSLIFFLLTAGCISDQKTPPPESIPGPSIIDLEDIAANSSGLQLTDAIGREITVPRNINHILCSGPGCMRYLTYLLSSDLAVGADQAERNTREMLPIPYLVANPKIRTLPGVGTETGVNDPAIIAGLDLQPDLIILMSESSHINADDIQKRTGIPVLVLQEGDLSYRRTAMNYTLRVMGLVLGKSERAEEVIRFFDKVTDNLQTRTLNIADFQQKKAYLGGYSNPEPRGLSSTTSIYIPFRLIAVQNIAEEYASQNGLSGVMTIPKEALSRVAPDAIFLDMTTWSRKESGVADLEKSEILQDVPSVKQGEVYGLLPTSLYGEDHESDLINAYVIGKALYPDKFTDVEPRVMADYIFSFLYGEPLFEEMNRNFGGMALSRIPLFT